MNSNFIIKDSYDIEKIRAKSGFCLTLLNKYKIYRYSEWEHSLEDQEKVLEYLSEIKKVIKLYYI